MKYSTLQYFISCIAVSSLFLTVAQSNVEPVVECNPSSQCFLEELEAGVSCTEAPFGNTLPPCYGHWTSFSSCNCSDPYFRLSSSGGTYWCNRDGHFDAALYDLECLAPCSTAADTEAVPRNSSGVITSIVRDGDYVSYSCPDGYTSSGDKVVTCKDGVWDKHAKFQCYGNCSLPENYEFVDNPEWDEVPEGKVITMKCKAGYLPSNEIVRTCKNESFEDVPQCRTGSCSPSCEWSSWCDDEPPNTKFLPTDETEDENSCEETTCDSPVNIECVTVADGVPHYAFPGVTCDLLTGLHCDASVMGICSNFQIRYECCTTC